MPRFDGTGPRGRGSKMGRGLGYCTTGSRPKPKKNPAQDILDNPYWRNLAKRVNILKGK